MTECLNGCDSRIAQLEDRLREQEARHEAFRARVHETAREYAERHDWCSVVDDALQEAGLPGLDREYTTTLTATLSFTVTSNGRSPEQAEEVLSRGFVAERIRDMDRSELNYAVDDYSAGEWEIADA